jgi:multicomponent Na+:H+ antiporter subunit C
MQNLIYFFAVIILTSGLFIMLTSDNFIRKIIGLGVFQSSVLIFYIALGKTSFGIVPIDICKADSVCAHTFSSPLPHVLMLTAIVVGFATMSVGLALVYQIHKEYGTVLESEIDNINGDTD